MSEEIENSSRVGFYLLPRPGREPSPPSPRHLQHRLSIINEASEESSAASSPLSSPSHKPLRQNKNADQKEEKKSLENMLLKTSFLMNQLHSIIPGILCKVIMKTCLAIARSLSILLVEEMDFRTNQA